MPQAVRKHQLKKKEKKKTANVKAIVTQAILAASLSPQILENPKAFTIGSACSGWCSELFACHRLQLPYIPVFACDINAHCKKGFLASRGPEPEKVKEKGMAKEEAALFGSLSVGLLPTCPVLEELKKLKKDGRDAYYLSWRMLNALDYGTPQNRERVMICGIRSDDGAREMAWPPPVRVRKSIHGYIDSAIEGDTAFPGRLPTPRSERRNVEQVLKKLQSQGRQPLQSPFVIDIGGSKPHFSEGYSPCITHTRRGSGGHWLTWKQRKMTTVELIQLMDVPPASLQMSRVSPRQIGLMAGNAIPVKMLSRVLLAALQSANMA
ncbi:unnamed protein product [Cladocopium goreaui]|uniref:Modification methylase NgoBI n=1 Tax=Cladocopium goreaui TaxID=2562237 RepID=A0A9P1DTA2_9DINO|nr:unnamed protein product [Cladocopium goreaui]